MALSDMWLRSVLGKSQTQRIEKADRNGLSVRVTPTGKVNFQLRFRINKSLEFI
ncbi:DUF4102 domain-containing protein [Parashewanella spongiae]|uniref:DUF4102 domain-containing protein n=1 Tax=Parashewanella spongiae TaxID=342950 RepID=A0A3A6SUI1_9GAMM|nr:Arm DNA-binding domain-containing protein [Parashewanella spongiae]MCL1080189.1 Arm DNA-binding domain-containing protein [Parashewanella spongiae]RJY02246.1 DUF4102 domain-containing protein [Parashewanella spongiae]